MIQQLSAQLKALEKELETLQKEKELTNQIISNLVDGFCIVDIEAKLLEVNEAMCKITGYSEEELVGQKPPYPYWPEEEYENIQNAFEQKVNDESDNFDLIFKRKNGERFPALVNTVALKDKKGNITHFFATIKDVSNERKADSDLKESEERYRALFERTSDGIYKTTPDGRFISANPALVKMLGYESEEELFNLDIRENLYFDKQERKLNSFQDIETYRVKKKDGTELWVEDQAHYTFDEHQNIIYCEGIIRDISERKKAEDELKKSERNLNEAQKLSKTGSWEFNVRTGALDWSDELYRIFELEGTAPEDLYMAFRDRVHKDDISTLDAKVERALNNDEGYVIEHRIYTRGEDIKYVFCKGEPVFDDSGQVLSLKGVTLDITEKKAQEHIIQKQIESLNKKNDELQFLIESNMQLENFAYIASHDLKSPVRTISSFSGLLKERAGDKLNDEEYRFLNFILKGAAEVQQLIEDLLSYSKIKNKGFDPEDLDVKVLLNSLVDTMSTDIKAHKAMIKIGEVPDRISGDRTKLWQLFQNLISNAIKFHHKDSFPQVEITGKTSDKEWVFAIKDNGIGIDPEFHNKVFVLFQQLNTKEHFEGTGLGLAICKKIVEQHKGRIWVESNPGDGSVFYFSIPENSKLQ